MSHQNNSPIAAFFYEMLLSFYPREYRAEYGEEMRLLFHDLYNEEHDRHGEIGVGFWFRLAIDVFKSTFTEHILLLKKIGIEDYAREIYHLDRPFFVGILLLLPFIVLSGIDSLTILFTANDSWLKPLYASSFWGFFACIFFIVFPLLAIVISVIYILKTYKREKHRVVSLLFLAHQFPRFVVIALGLLSLLIVLGHDFIPCIVQVTLSKGLFSLFGSMQYCVIKS